MGLEIDNNMGTLYSPDGFQSAHLVVQVDHSHLGGFDYYSISGGNVQGLYEPIYLETGSLKWIVFIPF
jgi:hypothetical protein